MVNEQEELVNACAFFEDITQTRYLDLSNLIRGSVLGRYRSDSGGSGICSISTITTATVSSAGGLGTIIDGVSEGHR